MKYLARKSCGNCFGIARYSKNGHADGPRENILSYSMKMAWEQLNIGEQLSYSELSHLPFDDEVVVLGDIIGSPLTNALDLPRQKGSLPQEFLGGANLSHGTGAWFADDGLWWGFLSHQSWTKEKFNQICSALEDLFYLKTFILLQVRVAASLRKKYVRENMIILFVLRLHDSWSDSHPLPPRFLCDLIALCKWYVKLHRSCSRPPQVKALTWQEGFASGQSFPAERLKVLDSDSCYFFFGCQNQLTWRKFCWLWF